MAKVRVRIEDCDERIKKVWHRLKTDPKADPWQCRREIDVWLDARLQIMKAEKVKR